MKKIILLLGIFFFTFSSEGFAVSVEPLGEGATTSKESNLSSTAFTSTSCSPALSKETFKDIKEFQKDEASLKERYTLDVVTGIFDIAGVSSIGNLILGNPYCVWTTNKNTTLIYGIFTEKEKEHAIDPIINLLKGSFLVLATLAILNASLRMVYGSIAGQGRERFKQEIYSWFLALFILIMYDTIVDYIFLLNNAFVSSIRDLMDSAGLDYESLSLFSSKKEFVFSDIFIFLAEGMLAIYMNLVYVFRKVLIFLLVMIGPLAALSLMFPMFRRFFSTWLKELIGIVFLQSIHSLILFIFIQISQMLPGEGGIIMKIGMLLFFIPLTSMIFGWIKLSESAEMVGKMAGTTIQSAASVANNVKRQMGSPTGNGSNGGNPSKISKLASGDGSKSWGMTKKAAGIAGAVIGGASGSVIGPMGASLGASAGASLSKGVLQGSRNIGAAGVGIKDSIKSAKGPNGFKESMKNIQNRREFFGNMGDSIGSIIGKGEFGRNIGHGLSGVSRQRIANSTELGGLGGLNLSNLSQQFPGTDVTWMQNNEGSAFYRQNGDEMERISPLGEGDSNLRNGENRAVDYRLNGANPLNNSSNGTYGMNQNGGEGIPTSSPHLSRTSDAYLGGGSGERMQDSRFDASSINPDSYYQAGQNGVDTRNTSDRFADMVSGNRHQGFS